MKKKINIFVCLCLVITSYLLILNICNQNIFKTKNIEKELKKANENNSSIIFANPNAPTGIALSRDEVRQMLLKAPKDKVFVVDENKTNEDLLALLLKTPILIDFSAENNNKIDKDKLDKYIFENTTNKGILLIRRYYGITAIK